MIQPCLSRASARTRRISSATSARGPATVISSSPGTPVLDLAAPILVSDVDERSVVSTRYATTALAILRWHLGQDLTEVAAQGQAVLDADDSSLGAAISAEQPEALVVEVKVDGCAVAATLGW